jgi:uncharacterized protein DUF6390
MPALAEAPAAAPASTPGPASTAAARPTAAPPCSGPVLFARYAFAPNRLGYCGPDAVEELLGEATSDQGEVAGLARPPRDDRPLRELARGFEGAWPYLELIARSNGIPDPLDRRVVEAYWLGSPLLDRVTPDDLAASLRIRFRPRLRPDGWRWLAEKPGDGAVPVHAFHVLDVFPRVGLLRSGATDRALEVMDSCRIRWGRILERDGDWLVVNAVPLAMHGGRLTLAPARPERIQAWRDGHGFVDGIGPGDVISIHWSFACDRLGPPQLANLIAWTRRELGLANATI